MTDYRDTLYRPPGAPDRDLALALGWQPWYSVPSPTPAAALTPDAWIAPDGTRHATLPDWRALLARVADLEAEVTRLQAYERIVQQALDLAKAPPED